MARRGGQRRAGSVPKRPWRGRGPPVARGPFPAEHPGSPGSQPGNPRGGARQPPGLPAPRARTPSSLHHMEIYSLPKVTRRRFLGLAARPPPPFPGSGPAAGIWAGERIPRSSDGPGEEGNSEPPHPPLSFPPGRAGGRRGRPLPCPAERSQGDLDSAAKFSSGIIPSAPWPGSALGQTRCPAPGLRSAGTRERSWVARPPQPGSPPLTHALPPLRLKRGSGCPRSGSPTPSQPAARGIPAAPLRRSRRSRRSRSCSPPPPRAAAAAPITTRRV